MGSWISKCGFSLHCCQCCKKDEEPTFSQVLTFGNCETSIEESQPPKQYSWDTRPKQNPLDYTISDLQNGCQIVKRPGEVNGQQFIIRNCSNSKIYIFDYCSQVTIDDCNDCLIVLGPVQGSVFLRDTKNSTLVCSSSQLRVRDCLSIFLFVGTESDPIIEASSEIIVGPYFLSYSKIRDHFNSAKISRFKAVHWSEVYDFTPNDVTPNWKCYDRAKHNPEKYICPPHPLECFKDLEIHTGDLSLSFIPVTQPNTTATDDEMYKFQGWKKKEIIFTQNRDQDFSEFENLMEKFYLDTFTGSGSSSTAFLCDVKTNMNQYIFTYYCQ